MDKYFESTYEHSSEPRKCVRVCSVDFYLKIKKKKKSESRKCGQLFFKFEQYCPHFLKNSMNIQVYV